MDGGAACERASRAGVLPRVRPGSVGHAVRRRSPLPPSLAPSLPARSLAACVFYVKGSRPLPREVLQCGRSPARAQAALPLVALSPLTATRPLAAGARASARSRSARWPVARCTRECVYMHAAFNGELDLFRVYGGKSVF